MFPRSSLLALFASCCLPALHAASTPSSYQIVLNSLIDINRPLVPDALVWDVDVLDTPATTIQFLKSRGKTVICYFSAGSYEKWRSDASSFLPSDLGNNLSGWPGERWLNTSTANVRSIMAARIKIAATKGCHAIDPDNVDVYNNQNGIGITLAQSVEYVQWLSKQAIAAGMQIGLKNAMNLLPQVARNVHFAVNEQCSYYNECNLYDSFIASRKPVYHIEYPKSAPSVATTDRDAACASPGVAGMSTVMKTWGLDGWVQYCTGSIATTATLD